MLEISEILPVPAKSVTVGSGKFGGSYTQVAAASVTFRGGPTMEAVIWARIARNRDTGEETITIEPGLPKGVKFDSEETNVEFKTTVLEHMGVWIGWKQAQAKAIERLTNPVGTSVGSKITYTVPAKAKQQADTDDEQN